jgi:hypothetical protein
MRKLLSIAIAAISAAAFAQEVPQGTAASTNETYVDMITGKPWTPDSKWTVEQLKARDERVLKKTGGLIDIKASGPELFVLDARSRKGASIDRFCELYTRASKLPVKSAHEPRGGKCPMEVAREKLAAEKALMVVVVVEGCDKLPALSVFPDERIGIVNADALKEGDDPVMPEVRVGKDIWRAVGYIGGMGFSPAPNDLMQPIFSVAELDACSNPYIQPMSFARMNTYYKHFGVTRPRRVAYRQAIKEGWAAAPTNDYQRAVWEEEKTNTVHKAVSPAATK